MTEQPDEKRRDFLIGFFGGWIINIGAWTITGGGMNNYYYKPLRRSISKEYFDLPRKKKISGAAAWVDLQSVGHLYEIKAVNQNVETLWKSIRLKKVSMNCLLISMILTLRGEWMFLIRWWHQALEIQDFSMN